MTIKKYNVFLSEEAENDIFGIYLYIAKNDSAQAALNVLNKLIETTQKLETMPERGNYLKELLRVGVLDFRELNFKPYRFIYQLINNKVYAHAVLDGRRDLEEHLLERLSTKISYQEENIDILSEAIAES
jgi:toxin ParE1/3/4